MNNKQIRIVFGLIAIILLINNWALPLWDQDEAAYAGFAKTMNQTGDYIIPDYYFSDDHRKTPLHFWNIAISYKIFGVNEFAVRLPSVLAILGTFLLVYFQGKKWFSEKTAFYSCMVLGSSFLVTSLAKISVTDATVLFFSTLAAFSIINTLLSPNKKWVFLFWMSFALGVLTKGPPIIIFTGLFIGILFVFHPNRFNLFKLHPWFFLPVAIAPVVYWGYLTYQEDPSFLEWMYDWYVLKRINGSVYDQSAPFGAHFILLMGFFLMSFMYFLQGFFIGMKSFIDKNFKTMLLACWMIAGWFLYEFTPSKLPAYIIAAHIPLAMLIGNFMANLSDQNKRPHIVFTVLHYVINFAFAIGLMLVQKFTPINDALALALLIIGVIYFILLIYQLVIIKKEQFYKVQGFGNLIIVLCIWAVAPLFSQHVDSSKKVSEYVLSKSNENTMIYISHAPGRQPSLPFYLSQNNNDLLVDMDKKHLLNHLKNNSNVIYVVSKEQKEAMLLQNPKLEFKNISSRIIDRKEQAEYYICTYELGR